MKGKGIKDKRVMGMKKRCRKGRRDKIIRKGRGKGGVGE